MYIEWLYLRLVIRCSALVRVYVGDVRSRSASLINNNWWGFPSRFLHSTQMPGPAPSAHQVLVYSGPGVSPLSLSHTLLTLRLLLLPHYTVQPAAPDLLADQPWEPSCALLVVPGGRDIPYVDELTDKRHVTHRIREYVEHGGRFLGICAGAYFASAEVRFDVGGGMEVTGKRDLVCSLALACCSVLTMRVYRPSSPVLAGDPYSRVSSMPLNLDPEPSSSISTNLPSSRHSTTSTTMAAAISSFPRHRHQTSKSSLASKKPLPTRQNSSSPPSSPRLAKVAPFSPLFTQSTLSRTLRQVTLLPNWMFDHLKWRLK